MEKKETKKDNFGIKLMVGALVVILVVVVIMDLVDSYVPLKDILTKTVNYTTQKEVTVTDEGIADAVEKLYDATVIVKITNGGKVIGWGSGVVYNKDQKYGYIFTNHHVVEDARDIVIEYTDGTETSGEVLGSDEYADVAVIRVDVNTIKAVAEIGKSEGLRPGDTVFAVGTPIDLAYKFTVTRGILSGKDRMVEMTNNDRYNMSASDSWYMNLLQIDASINSGNSGGPLANSNGEVIGITNSKLSSTYSSTSIENIGFAIPIEDALSVADKLINNDGKIERPVLGVSMVTIEAADYYDIDLSSDVTEGALVADVTKGSVADKAGLKKGDVIIKMEDYKIKDYMYLKYYLYRYDIGDTIKITYLRDNKEKEVSITLKD